MWNMGNVGVWKSNLNGATCSLAMEQLYRITTKGEGGFKDRGSKFLAFAFPLNDLSQLEIPLQLLKKKYYDARHHCYAYRLGAYGETTYATDDGEPAHTAGTPILSAIRSANLTDTLVVVIRYFGGTKLGVRGLIEAYRTAAEDALQQAQQEPVLHQTFFELTFPYDRTAELNRILHPFAVEQTDSQYTDICVLRYAIDEQVFPDLETRLTEAQFTVRILETD